MSRRDFGGPLQEPVAEGPLLPTGDLDPTAWDIPGELIVDARDDLDTPSILSLARSYGLRFFPTALERETREEIAEVPLDRMAEVMERLSRDPRVEGVEPLARVRLSTRRTIRCSRSSGTWSASGRRARGTSPRAAA